MLSTSLRAIGTVFTLTREWLSFDMFVITFFNIGAQSTLPMVIWSMVRLGINPTLNALGAMVIGFSILVLVAATRLGGMKLAG